MSTESAFTARLPAIIHPSRTQYTVMPYAIIRHEKIKTIGNLKASAEHTFRERPTDNADASKTHLNEHDGAISSDEVVQRFQQEFPEKLRKNGVLAVEYLMTASPEWWEKASAEQQAEFFKRSREFLYERHGKENVLYTGTQLDESTPHMVAYVLPRDDKGRMNAAHFLDGRKKLSECQDTYAEKVKSLGLERGIEGSTAKHERVKRHYGLLKLADKREPELSTKDKLSITIGKPTETALEALELRSARDSRDLTLNARKKGLEARERAINKRSAELDDREKAIKPREDALTRQNSVINSGKEAVERLQERVNFLEKALKGKDKELEGKLQVLRDSHNTENSELQSENRRLKRQVEESKQNSEKIEALKQKANKTDWEKARADHAEKILADVQEKGRNMALAIINGGEQLEKMQQEFRAARPDLIEKTKDNGRQGLER